jgi:hypothetical protein
MLACWLRGYSSRAAAGPTSRTETLYVAGYTSMAVGGEELSVVRCNGPRIDLPCTRWQSSGASTRETGHWSRGGGGAVLVLPVHGSSGNLCFSRACVGELGLVSAIVEC